MPRTRSVKTAKKEARQAFSKYIRRKECIESTGTMDRGICVTCGKVKSFSKLHAGHFTPGARGGILFDERCVHIQCYSCNRMRSGNIIEYYPWMLKQYGPDVVDELRINSKLTVHLSVEELDQIKDIYIKKRLEIERNYERNN